MTLYSSDIRYNLYDRDNKRTHGKLSKNEGRNELAEKCQQVIHTLSPRLPPLPVQRTYTIHTHTNPNIYTESYPFLIRHRIRIVQSKGKCEATKKKTFQ